MREIRIRTKVLGGFGVAIAAALAVGAASYVSARVATVTESQFPVHRALADAQGGIPRSHQFLSHLMLSGLTAPVLRGATCAGCHDAEQASSAAALLSGHSEQLAAMVGAFRIGGAVAA